VSGLSEEQARWAQYQVGRWLAIKQLNGQPNASQADADHSALLFRLLRGREPLSTPPITMASYPVYPDWPYEDKP
jgi:hypothetical protein